MSRRYPEVQTVVVELGAGEQIATTSVFKFRSSPDGQGSALAPASGPGPRICTLPKPGRAEATGGVGPGGGAGTYLDLGTRAVLTKGQKDRARGKALAKLEEAYPVAASSVLMTVVLPPLVGGHTLSDNSAKYASRIGAVTEVQVRVL